MRSRQGEQGSILLAGDPRHGAAVVEAHYQVHAHANAAPIAAYQSYDLGITLPQGHKIDQRYCPGVGLEFSFEYQGFWAIAAAHFCFGYRR